MHTPSAGRLDERLEVTASLVQQRIFARCGPRPRGVSNIDGSYVALLKVDSHPRDVAPIGHDQQRIVSTFAGQTGHGSSFTLGGFNIGSKALDLYLMAVAANEGWFFAI